MEFQRLSIDGLILVKLTVNGDERGFFTERFKDSEFRKAGLIADFVQDNHSRSGPGVLRGLHYQYEPAQAKLVGVTRGRIWDIAVDLRVESPTFGQHHSVVLTDLAGELFWIPPGFAHGFVVLGDEPADVLYKTTAEYNPAAESGITWNDPELKIEWPIAEPVVSKRDSALPSFADYRSNPPAWRSVT
ncbi:MAG TPA: dTDP-4-dehydrorhamnose 3,5-epimerase, partial [Pyrinomonadaceae bacterium]|nr:dTDP-4-dehydrorhamnose 3,5-epimerase [Pyrinomonadaceae bacterium]